MILVFLKVFINLKIFQGNYPNLKVFSENADFWKKYPQICLKMAIATWFWCITRYSLILSSFQGNCQILNVDFRHSEIWKAYLKADFLQKIIPNFIVVNGCFYIILMFHNLFVNFEYIPGTYPNLKGFSNYVNFSKKKSPEVWL